MTNTSLAQSYLIKARARLKILPVLMHERAWSDVVREAQEIVELALKGMLRHVGVEPPHWHDVGGLLKEHRSRFGAALDADIDILAATSAWLRKERSSRSTATLILFRPITTRSLTPSGRVRRRLSRWPVRCVRLRA